MTSSVFRPDIQGLRAVAVIIVIVFHFNSEWLPGGFVGVDVFLVISGFLIARILLDKKERSSVGVFQVLGEFYLSRFNRIAPAFFVMLIASSLVAAVLFVNSDLRVFKDSLRAAAWFNSNSFFSGFGDYFAPENYEQPLLHTWSLAVEIQFYLLAPYFILYLPIKWLKCFLVFCLVIITALVEYRLRVLGLEKESYYSLYARLPEFVAGMLVAVYVSTTTVEAKKSIWKARLGVALILSSAVFQPYLGSFPGVLALVPVSGAVLVLLNSSYGSSSTILESKIFLKVGALSYSLYLWHWPVLAFFRYYTGEEILGFGAALLFVFMTLVLSCFSYCFVENKVRRVFGFKKLVACWCVLIIGVLVVANSMGRINDMFSPDSLSVEYMRYADPSEICHGQVVGNCLRGEQGSNKEVLVLGDSHAAMLNHFFDYLGNHLGFSARVVTASSCLTMPGFDVERLKEWARPQCVEQVRQAKIYESSADEIILAANWSSHLKSARFVDALNVYLKKMSGNKRVLLLSQTPRFEKNVSRAQRYYSGNVQNDFELDVSYKKANDFLKGIAEKYNHVVFLELDDLPVFDNAPFYNGELIYFDKHHINEVGAKIYAEYALPKFDAYLAKKY